ncbi:hypothetical protein QTN25_001091 [Entamoeba marina]
MVNKKCQKVVYTNGKESFNDFKSTLLYFKHFNVMKQQLILSQTLNGDIYNICFKSPQLTFKNIKYDAHDFDLLFNLNFTELILNNVTFNNFPTNINIKKLNIINSVVNFASKKQIISLNETVIYEKNDAFLLLEELYIKSDKQINHGYFELTSPHLKKVDIINKSDKQKSKTSESKPTNDKFLVLKLETTEELILHQAKNIQIIFNSSLNKFEMSNCHNVNVIGNGNGLCPNQTIFKQLSACKIQQLSFKSVMFDKCENSSFILNEFESFNCFRCNDCTFNMFLKEGNNYSINLDLCHKVCLYGNLKPLQQLRLNKCKNCLISHFNSVNNMFVYGCKQVTFLKEFQATQVILNNTIDYIPFNFNHMKKLFLIQMKNIQFNSLLNGILELIIIECDNIKANISTLTQLNMDRSTAISIDGTFDALKELTITHSDNCSIPQINCKENLKISESTNVTIGGNTLDNNYDYPLIEIKDSNELNNIEKNKNVKIININDKAIDFDCTCLRELQIENSNNFSFNTHLLITKLELINSKQFSLIENWMGNESSKQCQLPQLPQLLHLKLVNSQLNVYLPPLLTFLEFSCPLNELNNLKSLKQLKHLKLFDINTTTKPNFFKLRICNSSSIEINDVDSKKLVVNEQSDSFSISIKLFTENKQPINKNACSHQKEDKKNDVSRELQKSAEDICGEITKQNEKKNIEMLEITHKNFSFCFGVNSNDKRIKNNELYPNSLSKIKEWSGKNSYSILFDSDVDGDGGDGVLREKVFGKSNLYFIHFDDNQNVFGGYVDKKIEITEGWIRDPKSFAFSLLRNGRVNNTIYPIRDGYEQYAIYLCSYSNNLYDLGAGADIQLYKIGNPNTYCDPDDNDHSYFYDKETKPFVNENEPHKFEVKRILVIQMS